MATGSADASVSHAEHDPISSTSKTQSTTCDIEPQLKRIRRGTESPDPTSATADTCDATAPVGLTPQQTDLLTSQYEVLRLLLSHLPCCELHRARAVCRAWRDVANILIRQRRIGHASRGRPLWDSEPVPKGQHAAETAAKLTRRLLARCHYEPNVALFVQSLRSSSGRRKAVPHLASLLPYTCFVAGVTSLTGCVATPAEGPPEEDQYGDRLGLLLLPRMNVPSCQMGAVILRVRDPATADQVWPQLPMYAWETLRGALVFFSSRRGMHAAGALARLLQDEFDGKVALAGGWTDIITPKAPPDSVLFVYFSGPSVRAASVVVNDDSQGADTLNTEQAASLLGKEKLPKENSLAFMIACCGRGEYEFVPGYEVSTLARHIPGVPVLGAFVNGELGCTMLPSDEKRTEELRSSGDMIMSYTTIFLQVSVMGKEDGKDQQEEGK